MTVRDVSEELDFWVEIIRNKKAEKGGNMQILPSYKQQMRNVLFVCMLCKT